MTDPKRNLTIEPRVGSGPSADAGDTGAARTDESRREQGISSRPGDADGADEPDGRGTDSGREPNPDDTRALKARQARGNLGPDEQKGFGQGG